MQTLSSESREGSGQLQASLSLLGAWSTWGEGLPQLTGHVSVGSVCPGWDCSSPLLQAWLEASNPRVVEETPRSSAHLLAAQIKKLGPGEASAQARICEVRPSPGPWRPSPGFSSHATVMYTFCHLAPRPTVFSEVSQQCLTLQVLQTSPRIRCPQHTITWVSSSLSVQFKPPLAIALAGGRCGEEALKVMPCPPPLAPSIRPAQPIRFLLT